MICPSCKGEGVVGGCKFCGTVKHITIAKEINSELEVIVPTYYKSRSWDILKAKKIDDQSSTIKVLELVNKLVISSNSGTLPNNSYMILLPKDHGKRIAMYTMIQNYLNAGLTVAPVVDIVSFNIISSRNYKEDQSLFLTYLNSDITFVYGTDFITRKLTSQIFRGLTSSRALKGKPTILFAGHSFKELSSWDTRSNLSLENNLSLEDHMSQPYILDGVIQRK